MARRREYTAQELLERLERERELARIRQAKWRAAHRITVTTMEGSRNGHPVTVTPLSSTRAQTPRSPDRSPTESDSPPPPIGDLERIRRTLAPFAGRGYVHDDAYWTRLAARFPEVDLVLEAYGIAEWLDSEKGAGRGCGKRFLTNWVKAEAAKRGPGAPAGGGPRPAPARTSAVGRVLSVMDADRAWEEVYAQSE